MNYNMAAFLIWPAFFVTIGLAMAFGFYGMANPKRSWQLELMALATSLLFALLCGTWISVIAGPTGSGNQVEVYALVAIVVMSGTLIGSIPRMLFQARRSNHWSLGFLFRLVGYMAMLVAFSRLVESRVLIVIPASMVLGAGFFLTLPAARRVPGNLALVFLGFPFVAYVLAVGTISVLEFYHSNSWGANLAKAMLPIRDSENMGQFTGVVAFLVIVFAVHVLMKHLSLPQHTRPSSLAPLKPALPLNDDAVFD